jgi:UDP-glucose 4-epimerase
MKVIVTGAAGFIGSHVCERLAKEKKIKQITAVDHLKDGKLVNLNYVLKSKKVKFIKCDIRNRKKISKIITKHDAVIHLAALSDIVPSIENPRDYLETNINGTLNILELMRKKKIKKIIYAGSSSCYGIPSKFPTREDELIDTRYPYSFSKYIGEQMIHHWSEVYNINYISLRLFNVYGTRSRTNGAYGAALGVFLKQKLEKKPFTVVGDGNQKRDFINVKDVADAFYKALISKKNNQIYNIGYGKPFSINKMLEIIGGTKIYIPKRPGEPKITHADIRKAKKMLNWMPKIDLENGLSEVIKNINYWKAAPLWDKKKIKVATKKWFKYLK